MYNLKSFIRKCRYELKWQTVSALSGCVSVFILNNIKTAHFRRTIKLIDFNFVKLTYHWKDLANDLKKQKKKHLLPSTEYAMSLERNVAVCDAVFVAVHQTLQGAISVYDKVSAFKRQSLLRPWGWKYVSRSQCHPGDANIPSEVGIL